MPVTINGDGTITGYTPPIADGSITSAKLANGAVGTNQLANGAATQAKRTYASGEIIQIKTDILDRSYMDLNTTETEHFGSDLEVSITFSSTNNKFLVTAFLPDVWNRGYTGDRALHAGFSISTDNWSTSNVFGNAFPISDYIAWDNASSLNDASWSTSGPVPTTSACKIRTRFKAVNGDVRVFANSMGVAHLSVMEIKG